MLAEYNGSFYEPLSLAMMRVLLGAPPVKPIVPETSALARRATTGWSGCRSAASCRSPWTT